MSTVRRSAHDFATTVSHLKQRLVGGGNTIFAEIDQAAAAKNAGLYLRPTTLLIFGTPAAGTPLMEADALAGLDLPLKLLIWEADDEVLVAYDSLAERLRDRSLGEKQSVPPAIDGKIATLLDAIAQS